MNLVILKGNLTKDPDVRAISSNGRDTKVATFTIATNRHFKKANGDKDKETTFTMCEAWDTGAESIEKLLKKGDPVLLNGSIKNESWDNAEGVRQYRTKVRVSNFEKLNRSSHTQQTTEPATAPAATTAPATTATPTADAPEGAEAGTGGDIPF